MIDTKAFFEENPHNKTRVRPWPDPKANADKTTAACPDDTKILCPPYVHGFCLGLRSWCRFLLDKKTLMDITWDVDMWKDLILPGSQERLVLSMVKRHSFLAEAKLVIIQGPERR